MKYLKTNDNRKELVAHYGKLYLDDVSNIGLSAEKNSQLYWLMQFKPVQICPRPI